MTKKISNIVTILLFLTRSFRAYLVAFFVLSTHCARSASTYFTARNNFRYKTHINYTACPARNDKFLILLQQKHRSNCRHVNADFSFSPWLHNTPCRASRSDTRHVQYEMYCDKRRRIPRAALPY
jgi:hypothetical protein